MSDKKKGMGNPLAIAAAADAGGKLAVRGADFAQRNAKPIIAIMALILVIAFGPKYYRQLVAKNYIRNNPGSKYVRASFMIANSIDRFVIPGIFGPLIDFNYNTDEQGIKNAVAALDYSELAKAYYKLFGRNIDSDLKETLDRDELSDLYDVIDDHQTTEIYPVGSLLYVKSGKDITINKAQKVNDKWIGTNDLYLKNIFNSGDEIGYVEYSGIVPQNDPNGNSGKRYYIVKDCFLGMFCDYGVVIHSQVINKK